MMDWHEEAYGRVVAGIEEKWLETCARHFVAAEFACGCLAWFKAAHPEAYQKWSAASLKIDEIWLSGRTDAEAQKEFNAALRVYRDGALWALERYIGHKKDREAKERAAAAMVGKQEAMTLR